MAESASETQAILSAELAQQSRPGVEFGDWDYVPTDTGGGPNLNSLSAQGEPLFNEPRMNPTGRMTYPEKFSPGAGSYPYDDAPYGAGPWPSAVNGAQVTNPAQLTIPWDGKSLLMYRRFIAGGDAEPEYIKQARKQFGRSL